MSLYSAASFNRFCLISIACGSASDLNARAESSDTGSRSPGTLLPRVRERVSYQNDDDIHNGYTYVQCVDLILVSAQLHYGATATFVYTLLRLYISSTFREREAMYSPQV